MARPFRLRNVTRRRLVWLVALLLLWQQVALAAYVCQTVPGIAGQETALTLPAAAPATTAAMTTMGEGCAEMAGRPTSPMCPQHCTPDHATQVDARLGSVPLSALTAVPPMLMSVASSTLPSDRALARRELQQTGPAVARLLFCTLLI